MSGADPDLTRHCDVMVARESVELAKLLIDENKAGNPFPRDTVIVRLSMMLRDVLDSLSAAERDEIRAHFDDAGDRVGVVPSEPLALHDVLLRVADLTRYSDHHRYIPPDRE